MLLNEGTADGASGSRPLRDLIVILVGRSILIVISIATIRLLTTFLSPFEVGRYNILFSLGTGLTWVLISPVSSYVNRRIAEWARAGAALFQLGWYVLIICAATGLSILSVLALKWVGWLGLQISNGWLVVAVVAIVLVSNLSLIAPNILNLFERRVAYVLTSVLAAALALGCSVVLVIAIQADAERWIMGALAGQTMSVAIGSVLLVNLLRRRHRIGVAESSWGGVLRFAAPVAAFNILYWGQTQGFRFALDEAHGLAVVGLFTIGFSLGVAVVAAVDQVLTQYFNPIFYRAVSDSDHVRQAVAWNRYTKAFIPAIVLVTLFTIGVGPYLAHLLTGEAFAATAARVVAFGALAEGLRALIALVSLVAHARLETRPLVVPGIVGVAVSLGGTIALARIDPIAGTGLSVVIGAATWLTLLLLAMRRLMPDIRVPWRRALIAAALSTPLLLPLVFPWARNPSLSSSVLVIVGSGMVMILMQYSFIRSEFPRARQSDSL